MPMPALAEPDQSTAERYEALFRIANSIRERKEPRELFGILPEGTQGIGQAYKAGVAADLAHGAENAYGPELLENVGVPD